jgi:hypothetical protein
VPDDAVQRWDRNAAFCDDQMGVDGNSFFLTLTRPALERLLGEVAGHRVLEIACGNGLFARRPAGLGRDAFDAVVCNMAQMDMAERRSGGRPCPRSRP